MTGVQTVLFRSVRNTEPTLLNDRILSKTMITGNLSTALKASFKNLPNSSMPSLRIVDTLLDIILNFVPNLISSAVSGDEHVVLQRNVIMMSEFTMRNTSLLYADIQ